MSRINTNVNSLIAQRVLTKNNKSLNTSLERLSTGLRINKGSDNPAGLIASESLRAEKAGIAQALENTERASNLIGTAEGGLNETSALLTELQGLVTQASNSGALSNDEIAANQLQIDSILNTVNRLANSTEFQGKKLLDGSLGYSTSSVVVSTISNLRINSARLPDGATQSVTIAVTSAAIGIPLGLVVGRAVWNALVGDMGVVADPDQPWAVLLRVLPVSVALAPVAAWLPSRGAVRLSPSAALRAE